MNTSLETYIALGAILFLFVILFFWLFKTESRLKRFFMGSKAKSLEEAFVTLTRKVAALEEDNRSLRQEISVLHKKARESIRRVETIRFNPFKDAGSNQSFAIGLMNEDKDGIVISSLYSRERMSVFAKPIKNGVPEFDLTHEEKQVLKKASNF